MKKVCIFIAILIILQPTIETRGGGMHGGGGRSMGGGGRSSGRSMSSPKGGRNSRGTSNRSKGANKTSKNHGSKSNRNKTKSNKQNSSSSSHHSGNNYNHTNNFYGGGYGYGGWGAAGWAAFGFTALATTGIVLAASSSGKNNSSEIEQALKDNKAEIERLQNRLDELESNGNNINDEDVSNTQTSPLDDPASIKAYMTKLQEAQSQLQQAQAKNSKDIDTDDNSIEKPANSTSYTQRIYNYWNPESNIKKTKEARIKQLEAELATLRNENLDTITV